MTFHVAVSVPPKESYLLYIVTNPLDACRVALYKEHFVRTAAGWIPETLTEVQRLPDFGTMPDPDDVVAGQTTRAYLLDVWIPPDADVGRFRLEVQLKVAGWTIRPMEVRVVPARLPDLRAGPSRSLPEIKLSAAAAAVSAFRDGSLSAPPPGLSLRGILRRNAIQDLALARDRGTLAQRVLDLFRANTMFRTPVWGAEWWLRVRDSLLAER